MTTKPQEKHTQVSVNISILRHSLWQTLVCLKQTALPRIRDGTSDHIPYSHSIARRSSSDHQQPKMAEQIENAPNMDPPPPYNVVILQDLYNNTKDILKSLFSFVCDIPRCCVMFILTIWFSYNVFRLSKRFLEYQQSAIVCPYGLGPACEIAQRVGQVLRFDRMTPELEHLLLWALIPLMLSMVWFWINTRYWPRENVNWFSRSCFATQGWVVASCLLRIGWELGPMDPQVLMEGLEGFLAYVWGIYVELRENCREPEVCAEYLGRALEWP